MTKFNFCVLWILWIPLKPLAGCLFVIKFNHLCNTLNWWQSRLYLCFLLFKMHVIAEKRKRHSSDSLGMRGSQNEHQKIKSQTTRRVKTFSAWKGPPTAEVFSWKDFSSAKYFHSMTECHSQGFLPGFFLKSAPFSQNLAGLGESSEQDIAIPQGRRSKLAWPFEAIPEGITASTHTASFYSLKHIWAVLRVRL